MQLAEEEGTPIALHLPSLDLLNDCRADLCLQLQSIQSCPKESDAVCGKRTLTFAEQVSVVPLSRLVELASCVPLDSLENLLSALAQQEHPVDLVKA